MNKIQLYNNNITKLSIEFSNKIDHVKCDLSKKNIEILNAIYVHPKIASMPDKDSVNLLITNFINRILFETGAARQYTGADGVAELTMLVKLVIDMIDKDFPTATLGDLQIALTEGSRGNYGENYGISVNSFYKWMKYYFNESRRIANFEYQQLLMKHNELMNEKKVNKEFSLDLILSEFDKMKDNESYIFNDYNAIHYDYLFKNKIIIIDSAEKFSIYNDTKAKLIQQDRHNASEKGFPLLKDAIKSMNNNEDEVFNSIVILESKKVCLNNWMHDLVESGVELVDLINQKIE